MSNSVNWDVKLNKYVFESCINCGNFIRTNDKTRLTLFMMDHYGKDGIRLCKSRFYGKIVWTLANWKYKNY